MNKAKLVEEVAAKVRLSKKEVNSVVDAMTSTITKSLARGKKVTLTGFGTFQVQRRKARQSVASQTRDRISIPAKDVPQFVPEKTKRDMRTMEEIILDSLRTGEKLLTEGQIERMIGKVLTVKETARYLNLNPQTVSRKAQIGVLPAFRIGNRWRFRLEEVDQWITDRLNGRIKEESFEEKVDRIWNTVRMRAEKAGYGAKDIGRLIREVRAEKETSGS